MWSEIATGAGIAIPVFALVLARLEKANERAKHDGADDERWRIQLVLNGRIEDSFDKLKQAVARIEGKLGLGD